VKIHFSLHCTCGAHWSGNTKPSVFQVFQDSWRRRHAGPGHRVYCPWKTWDKKDGHAEPTPAAEPPLSGVVVYVTRSNDWGVAAMAYDFDGRHGYTGLAFHGGRDLVVQLTCELAEEAFKLATNNCKEETP